MALPAEAPVAANPPVGHLLGFVELVRLPWFNLYDADKAYVGGSETLMDVWSVEELDEARVGPAVLKDPSLEVGGGQVVELAADLGAVRDGEW